MKLPRPTHQEQIAAFRQGVIGDLLAQNLVRGELVEELHRRAERWYLPPGCDAPRRFHPKTLQRWYYLAKEDASRGLLPASRACGFALSLSSEQRELLLRMRAEHPSVAAELLLVEAIRHGIVAKDQLSLSTLRRLFASQGLTRVSQRREKRADIQRRRWQAASPGDLWHADVCHVGLLDEVSRPWKAKVHGILDDASRYAVALVARLQETERDLLEVFCGALLKHPPPLAFYVDNGSCYRGDVLALICQRLGIRLIHARPYSPEARGTQERYWRTMRQRCTDLLPPCASLHDLNQTLWAWVDADYNRRPHAGLMGDTPRSCYMDSLASQRAPLSPRELARALEVEQKRRIRKDATFSLDGVLYEVSGRHLAGKQLSVWTDGLTGKLLRATWQDQPVRVGLCDPVANRSRPRPKTPAPAPFRKTTPFDPIAALLQKAREEVPHD